MKVPLRIRFKIIDIFSLLAVSILLVMPPSSAWGQLPVNIIQAEQEEQKTEKIETTEQLLERLQQLQAKARQSLNSAQPVLENTPPEQLGATTEEAKEKQFLLLSRVFLYGKNIENLSKLEEIRLANEDLVAKSEAWQGFTQDPPYPISLVDELRDSIHAQSLAITKDGVRIALIQLEQDEALKSLVSSEKKLRKVRESLEKPVTGDDQIRANWLHELAKLKNAVAELNVLASKAQLQAVDESLSLYNKQRTFLERQLQVAVTDATFSKKELDQKLSPLGKKINLWRKRSDGQSGTTIEIRKSCIKPEIACSKPAKLCPNRGKRMGKLR